ncbi:hypothetical protein [Pseudomonas sp. SBB6]|uniref:hypothetical protein n=1 Tax=Pseudomonas sp. SBB6 TaxID=2962032 RepID=UPI0020B79BCC|nr:hypothetical protein [Pseudomonas sp. SBB6]MCP3750986.1 hypothetical protein [Pseudomonas sp. SBB6]
MPIRRTGTFDLTAGAIKLAQDRLAGFLSENELAQTQVQLVNGKLSFNAPDSVLKKITEHFGQPAS